MAAEYLQRAEGLLTSPAPCVIAIGGFSGSGKSTLAQALAPSVGSVPGAVLVRSDEVRKRMFGVSPLVRLGPEGYEPEVSRRVYTMLADSAAAVIRLGHTVIVDAVFARPADRDALEVVIPGDRFAANVVEQSDEVRNLAVEFVLLADLDAERERGLHHELSFFHKLLEAA